MQIENARYMGHGQPAKLTFNPWLNALVGGRGTGKSTVIHALRLASRRERELDRLVVESGPRSTFERFNRVPTDQTKEGGLLDETSIQLTVMRDDVRHRVHWRSDGTGVPVEDELGCDNWKPSSAQNVTPERFPLRIYSQGQITELSGDNQQALLGVIDQAAGVATLYGRLDEARSIYYATRARIRELDSRLERRDNLTVDLQDVERKLERFEEAGHAAVLTAYRRRDRQRREADRQFEVAEEVAGRIESVADELQIEDLPNGLFDEASEEDRAVVEIVATLGAAVSAARQSLQEAAHRLREAVGTQRAMLISSDWQKLVTQAAVDYDSLVEALQEEGVADPSEYGRLVQERQRLEGEVVRLVSEKEDRDRLIEQSQEQLMEVANARRAMGDVRNEFLSATLARNDFVRIEISPYGDDPRVIERSLREALDVLDDRFEGDILSTEEDGTTTGCVADFLADVSSDSNIRRSEFESRLERLKQRFEVSLRRSGRLRRDSSTTILQASIRTEPGLPRQALDLVSRGWIEWLSTVAAETAGTFSQSHKPRRASGRQRC